MKVAATFPVSFPRDEYIREDEAPRTTVQWTTFPVIFR